LSAFGQRDHAADGGAESLNYLAESLSFDMVCLVSG
jgi:hypothetical protein